MQKLKQLTTALCMTAVIAAGCSSDSTGPEENPGASTMTATIDGAAWTPLVVLAARSGTTVSFSGTDAQDREIIISMTGVTASGPFAIGPSGAASVQLIVGSQAWVGHLAGATGSVVLSNLTAERGIGTFSVLLQPQTPTGATGTRTIVGTFNVRFGQT